jgi:hypothetical protein
MMSLGERTLLTVVLSPLPEPWDGTTIEWLPRPVVEAECEVTAAEGEAGRETVAAIGGGAVSGATAEADGKIRSVNPSNSSLTVGLGRRAFDREGTRSARPAISRRYASHFSRRIPSSMEQTSLMKHLKERTQPITFEHLNSCEKGNQH